MQSYQIFEGLKVVELASVLAGPSVGQFFAELGAEVIKVENPLTGGDVTRAWKLPEEDPYNDRPAYFSAINWGKKSVAINAALEEGSVVLKKLVSNADILITSFKPGDAYKFGLDYQQLKEGNPKLIYGSISGYPGKSLRAGYDAIIQAETGFMSINGEASGPPIKMPVALVDILAAHHLKEGILAALYSRNQTGKGMLVEVSLFDTAISSLANQATNYLVAGVKPQRSGSEHPNIAPYGTIFTTADNREVVVAIGNDAQFKKFCEVIGAAELIGDKRFLSNHSRVQNRGPLNDLIREKVSGIPAGLLLGQLQQASVPAGQLLSVHEAIESSEARHMILETLFMKGLRNIAFRLDGYYSQLPAEPPHLGENNIEVLNQLGFTETEINRFKLKGVLA